MRTVLWSVRLSRGREKEALGLKGCDELRKDFRNLYISSLGWAITGIQEALAYKVNLPVPSLGESISPSFLNCILFFPY